MPSFTISVVRGLDRRGLQILCNSRWDSANTLSTLALKPRAVAAYFDAVAIGSTNMHAIASID